MLLSEVEALLRPTPLPLETGFERSPEGVLHVAARTDMHGCTGEMFEWWFRDADYGAGTVSSSSASAASAPSDRPRDSDR